MKAFKPLWLSTLFLLSCHAGSAWAQDLQISKQQQALLGIELLTVVASTESEHSGSITLRVGFSPDAEWAITAPLSGILQRTWVQIGDQVEAGAPLVTVRSSEIVELQQALLEATAQLELQQAMWERDQQLAAAGSISKRRQQETQFAWDSARSRHAGLKAQLLFAGLSEADLDALMNSGQINPDFTLRSPAKAVVLERPAMLGDHLEGSEVLVRLGEPDHLILSGVLSRSASAWLQTGDRLVLHNGSAEAVLVFISTVIDPMTQTVHVRALPDNNQGLFPGQLSQWQVLSRGNEISVPSRAVVKLGADDVIFVSTDAGFEARVVQVRSGAHDQLLVLQGLAPGEQVAVSGTAALKGMSLGVGEEGN